MQALHPWFNPSRRPPFPHELSKIMKRVNTHRLRRNISAE
jgi:hypothetical protein